MAGLADIGSAIGAPLTKLVGDVLNRVLPAEKMSEKDRATIESEVLLEVSRMDFSSITGQLQINLEEAKSSNLFVAGWRPFIGWTCGTALAYHFIAQPALAFFIAWYKWQAPPLPSFDMGSLMTILLGMLGLGAARTYEKIKGVAGK